MTIPLFHPVLSARAVDEAQAALRSGWLGTGPRTKEFEAAFASYCAAESCVATASASDALRIALTIADVADSEVVTTALTYVASTNAILHAGATPVFADVQASTGNLEPADVERCITDETSALLIVHYGGCPADLAELRDIADRHHLRVIEDAAHAAGSSYRGNPIGSGGDLHAFSFSAVKNLTAAGGGALLCSNADDAERARRLRSHGIDREAFDRMGDATHHWDYEVSEPGFGCAMGDVNAAIGSAQLLLLDAENVRRHEIAAHYRRRLASVAGLQLTDVPADRETNDHLFVVLAEERDALIESLFAHDIVAGVHYRRIDSHVPYKLADLPVTEWFSTRAVSLPMHLVLTDDDVERICDVIVAGWST